MIEDEKRNDEINAEIDSAREKRMTQSNNDKLNDELFGLDGAEQIVYLLKKIVKNQERDNERQDRRDSAFSVFLKDLLPEILKKVKR